MLHARLFGALSVQIDGRELPTLPGLRPRTLLAYLLFKPGPHPRERLAGRFWPDVLDTSARASLRNCLSTVRLALEAVGGGGYLVADRVHVGLSPILPREIDVERFDHLVATGDPESLGVAVALAVGPLLSDLADDWVVDAQEDYRLRLVGALEALADSADAAGDLVAAVRWTRKALEVDSLREGAHRSLMLRLAANGDRAQALAAYQRCRAILAAELGMLPSAETRSLGERLRSGEVDRSPALITPTRSRSRNRYAPMAGRREELGLLLDTLAETTGHRGSMVVITGEAGIGKSRLVAEVTDHARRRGMRVVSGAGLELEGGPPFGLWSEVLRDVVALGPGPPVAASWPAELARLSPSVESGWSRPPSPPSPTPDLERARLFEAMVEMSAWCSMDTPMVIVLEDLHWADPISLTLLAYLGRRLSTLPILVLATRRTALRRPDLDLVIEDLTRRGVVTRSLALGPLPNDHLMTLVRWAAPDLDSSAAEQAVVASEGNSLLALAAARALALGGDPARGLAGRVRGPLGRLSSEARLLADVAAVAGRPIEFGEGADLIGVDALPRAVDDGIAAELFDSSADGRIAFAHSLLREACEAELSAARRRWVHGRLAGVLAARPGRAAAEVARHLRLAGDDAAARPQLVAAAREARALGALVEAAAYLTEAAGLASDEPLVEAELMLALGDVEALRGDRPAVDDAFERARALLVDAGDAVALAGAYAARGRWLRGTICYPRESLAAYRIALDLLDPIPNDAPELYALALAGAAWAESLAGDPARAHELIAAAEAVPEGSGDQLLEAELAMARAAALMRAGRFAEAEAPSERAAELAERCGRPDLAHGAWDTIASAAASRGDFQRALDLATRGLRHEGRSLSLESDFHAARAYALSRLGRHSEAEAAARQEVELAARFGHVQQEATAYFDLGSILLASDAPTEAATHLRAALDVPSVRFSRILARIRLAEALVNSGELEAGTEELGRVPFEPIGPADVPDTLVARVSHLQGVIAAARGDTPLALARLGEAERVWRRHTGPRASGDAFAANITDLGRPPVAGLVEPGLELGRVLSARASVLAMEGRLEESHAAALEASDLADALGFDGYRAELAALG
jgi:DNA-binding SARP family transcriptional activator/tetratricopeptide (TPR) repeat protein